MSSQLPLVFEGEEKGSYYHTFKDLYYHLYSNSDSSRAERIASDVSKIIIAKLIEDRNGKGKIDQFCKGEGTADELIIPVIRESYGSVFDESDRFHIDDDFVRESFDILEDISLTKAPSHALGEAFQALIGPRLRGNKGQFFTPRSVVDTMVEVADPSPDDIVVDPACGTGGFLNRTYMHWDNSFDTIDGTLIGIDKDIDLSRLAVASTETICGDVSRIYNKNSLVLDELSSIPNISKADIVLTNPPFGSNIGIKEESILRAFDLGYKWSKSKSEGRWIKTKKLRKSQDPQILFIELCTRILSSGGIMGIILPEGIYGNRKSGYIWDYIRERGEVEALIDCPRTTFEPGTDTKTNILFWRKGENNRDHPLPNPTVPIAVALNCGHDKKGRTETSEGTKIPNDFPAIADEYGSDDSKYWSDRTIDNPHYWVPRFYDGRIDQELKKKSDQLNGDLFKLQQLIDEGKIITRKGHEVGSQAYGTGEIPFVRTSDISNWEISSNTTKSVGRKYYDKYKDRQNLTEGDVLLVMDGRFKIGKSAIVHEHNELSVIQSHIMILSTTDKAKMNGYQLLYLLNLPIMMEQLRNLSFVQSTLGNIGRRIYDLKIPIPSSDSDWPEEAFEFEKLLRERGRVLSKLRDFYSPKPEL